MTFNPFAIERKARVTVTVTRPDSSGEATPEVYTFVQHRMRIQVRQSGKQFANAKVEIFGIPLDTMNTIARLWLSPMTPQNTDTVAIDIWDGMDYLPFFQGVISWSAVNGTGMPAVSLAIEANAALALMNDAVSPYANAGPVKLSDALTAIIKPQGFVLDFSEKATDYLMKDQRATGSPLQQVGQILDQFSDLTWSPVLQRVVVRRVDSPFSDDTIEISPATGLQRLPTYSSSGIQFDTIFNQKLIPGRACDIQTAFDFVNRTLWVAAVLAHTLDANVPGGQWTTSVAANAYGPKGNNQS
ncbi:MAG TPA: hypothetical protein VN289_02715 [Paraburkholderia sp.]|nr:hypothetical protein [Paraburkholderia sp.]